MKVWRERGMVRLGTNGSPDQWMKSSPHWLFLLEFLFEMLFVLIVFSQCAICVSCVAKVFNAPFRSRKWENGDWHHPKYQMMWLEEPAVNSAEETHLMLNAGFLWCEAKVLGLNSNDPVAYYIAFLLPFCIAFYCQLDLQWENYTMLVFLFHYASVFDFPKYKKLYIALCYGRKYFRSDQKLV